MKKLASVVALASTIAVAAPASADTFADGSLIIPMDTDYQDMGMLRAYGLVYELLRQGVPVRWVIKPAKLAGEADFVADASDLATSVAIAGHGYRGGPFVVDSADAAVALPIIQAWQTTYPETAVHQTTAQFDGDVEKHLIAAPKVAMFADGNQKIARQYLQAAGIPDSTLDLAWDDDSPDMLDVDEVSGPTTTSHTDGSLFDADGDPAYCQFMSMHWGVGDAEDNPEVIEEVRAYLQHPTHFYAQCQAVNAFENHGHYLTSGGFDIANKPGDVQQYQPDSPFAQIDGTYGPVGGSEPAFTLASGSTYLAGGVSLLGALGATPGVEDVWMTGWIGGACDSSDDICNGLGKVSYLGGHEHDTKLPISSNPESQGTRMFLNSLFDSTCATQAGAPSLTLNASAPATVQVPEITFTIDYTNFAGSVASDAVLENPLPAGTTFVSADQGGVYANGMVTWSLGNLGVGETGAVTLVVSLPQEDTYLNEATLSYDVGLTSFSLVSNQTSTQYDLSSGSGGAGGGAAGGSSGSSGGAGSGGDAPGGASSGSSMGGGDPGSGGSFFGDGGNAAGGNGDAGDAGLSNSSGDAQDAGGCACSAAGSGDENLGWLCVAVGVGLVLLRRRQQLV